MTTTSNTSDDGDLFDALSAITVTGPDASGLLWISFNTEVPLAMLSVPAGSVAGPTMARWRDIQSAALSKAVLARATKDDT
jgi:hypothetical protein